RLVYRVAANARRAYAGLVISGTLTVVWRASMAMGKFCVRIGWLALLLCASAAPALADSTPVVPAMAIMETPKATPLADILSGRAQPGFTPEEHSAIALNAPDGRSLWLRLRVDVPADGHARWLIVDRQPIDHLRLYLPDAPSQVFA